MGNKSFEDLMNMSDDDLMSKVTLETPEEEEIPEVVPPEADPDEQVETPETPSEEQEDEGAGSTEEKPEATPEGEAKKENEEKDESKPAEKPKVTAPKTDAEKPKDQKADGKTPEDKAKNNQVEPDYKAMYEKIMTPFKANGREIKLENVDEAVKLMQMGANYTKKMQAIQPNIKILRMLENNQLLDEAKINQLIDITKGDKTAIAKFVKDSGIDPMDIDTETAVNYKPGNHSVSDSEISFESVLDEAASTDHGQALIIQMNHSWDEASKKAIFDEPELIRVLTQQKADGIFDQIADEVERQKTLGNTQIARLSFIKAYETVGKQLATQGKLKVTRPTAAAPTQKTPTELGRGTAPVKKTVTNDEQAKAASPSAKSAKKTNQTFNPLEMSDEEFLKSMDKRV